MSNATSTSTFTYDDDTYRDLYKAAYNVRPGSYAYSAWNAMTPEEKQTEWDYLCNVAEATYLEELREEYLAMVRFEALVETTIKTGAGDRETAVRWLMDAADLTDDVDHFTYTNGLPFGYFGGTMGMDTFLRGY